MPSTETVLTGESTGGIGLLVSLPSSSIIIPYDRYEPPSRGVGTGISVPTKHGGLCFSLSVGSYYCGYSVGIILLLRR